MTDPFIAGRLAAALDRGLTAKTCRCSGSGSLFNWAGNHCAEWAEPLGVAWAPPPYDPEWRLGQSDWEGLGRAAAQAAAAARDIEDDDLARNTRDLAVSIGIDADQARMLEVLVRIDEDDSFYDLAIAFSPNRSNDRGRALAFMAGVSTREARNICRGPLSMAGLVHPINGGHNGVRVNSQAYAALLDPGADREALQERLLGPRAKPRLSVDDFAHLRGDLDLASGLLRSGTAVRQTGLNILLYGPPGVGKSELARLIAAEAGLQLHAVGESGDEHDAPARGDRVTALVLAQRLAGNRADVAFLFDEMEDLLAGGRSNRGEMQVVMESKGFINRLVEDAATPVIWTTNRIDTFDRSMLRRMSHVIEVRPPSADVRRRIWSAAFDRAGLAGDRRAPVLADRYARAPASVAVTAARAAELCPALETAPDRVAGALMRCIDPSGTPSKGPAAFDLRLVNADRDLLALCRELAGRDHRAVSFLLTGPPGTGKSAFLRHLAGEMGLEVMHKRASDLLSKWVGESEQRIAAAFREAEDKGAFLIFDEADSLLSDRQFASANWEVSQVNEMLTWMESHPQPFACTTNLDARLDPAVRRRFLVKARLDYMSADQVAIAFEVFFGREAPSGLPDMPALTPADFALVARLARLEAGSVDDQWLVDRLEAEMEAKTEGQRRRIGFQTSRD